MPRSVARRTNSASSPAIGVGVPGTAWRGGDGAREGAGMRGDGTPCGVGSTAGVGGWIGTVSRGPTDGGTAGVGTTGAVAGGTDGGGTTGGGDGVGATGRASSAIVAEGNSCGGMDRGVGIGRVVTSLRPISVDAPPPIRAPIIVDSVASFGLKGCTTRSRSRAQPWRRRLGASGWLRGNQSCRRSISYCTASCNPFVTMPLATCRSIKASFPKMPTLSVRLTNAALRAKLFIARAAASASPTFGTS